MVPKITKAFYNEHGREPNEAEYKAILIVAVFVYLLGFSLIALGISSGMWMITLGRVDFFLAFWTSLGFVGLYYLVTGEKKK